MTRAPITGSVARRGPRTHYFQGAIKSMQIWSRALDEAEVASLYALDGTSALGTLWWRHSRHRSDGAANRSSAARPRLGARVCDHSVGRGSFERQLYRGDRALADLVPTAAPTVSSAPTLSSVPTPAPTMRRANDAPTLPPAHASTRHGAAIEQRRRYARPNERGLGGTPMPELRRRRLHRLTRSAALAAADGTVHHRRDAARAMRRTRGRREHRDGERDGTCTSAPRTGTRRDRRVRRHRRRRCIADCVYIYNTSDGALLEQRNARRVLGDCR